MALVDKPALAVRSAKESLPYFVKLNLRKVARLSSYCVVLKPKEHSQSRLRLSLYGNPSSVNVSPHATSSLLLRLSIRNLSIKKLGRSRADWPGTGSSKLPTRDRHCVLLSDTH
jgi:hypothetical protein